MAGKTELEERVKEITAAGFRGSLLARGLARELIWRDGELPEGAPHFAHELTTDLLDYGFTLLRLGLQLRVQEATGDVLDRAFRTSAEAIEAAVRNGDPDDPARGFHRVVAGSAYHLARYSARAFCLIGNTIDDLNLNPAERAVALLIRRDLKRLENISWELLTNDSMSDQRLSSDVEELAIDEENALQVIANNSIVRAVSIFMDSLESGDVTSRDRARVVLDETIALTAEVGLVTLWWLSYITRHLLDDLWDQSLHARIPPSLPQGGNEWKRLRSKYIGVLWARDVAEIELWPSQIEAAARAQDVTDDLIAALPTGAGKTRIAELAILRTLADGKRVVYVTPLRSLSAQLESTLRRTFRPLEYSVSSLYGASGSTHLDADSLKNRHIVVSTPEKLDFALRNASDLIDDVGLIVLDEGHTIGAGEREVRYEVLVQRLLRRSDANERRLVCLSAILPEGERLEQFVAWLRDDQPGAAITCNWRPSRQRFGTIVQRGNHARLDLQVETEAPYIPFFLSQVSPPPKSQRRKLFPSDCSELVLASAWEFVKLDQGVMIFCPLRKSVEKLARLALQLTRQGLLTSLLGLHADIQEAVVIGQEWLGGEHPAVQCLELGVAVHHAKLPRQFLQAIESLLSKKVLNVVIASPTLAQGLNLSAATVIMNSIHRGQEIIKGEEFANVAGRAGRAFVDIDGQVLYPIFEAKTSMINYKLSAWSDLIKSAQQRNLTSGIVQLVIQLFQRLAVALGTTDTAKITDYVFNQTDWDSIVQLNERRDAERYEEQLRSIDVALLSLVDNLKCDASEIAAALDDALKNSLWSRQLKENATPDTQIVLRAILESRALHIWGMTTPIQRRGFYFAGIGLKAGLAIDNSLEVLLNLLSAGEELLKEESVDDACRCIEEFSEIVFEIAPFIPDALPSNWRQILKGWLTGITLSELQKISDDANEFIQDGVCYKLTWAVEAVRARAASEDEALDLKGTITTALDVGATGVQDILLLRAGLRSRTLARQIVYVLSPTFKGFMDMHHWLSSTEVKETLQEPDWPTPEFAAEWHRFVNSNTASEHIRWSDQKVIADVDWLQGNTNKIGQRVRLYRDSNTITTYVFDLELNRCGQLKKHFPRRGGPEVVVIGPKTHQITIDSFGPST